MEQVNPDLIYKNEKLPMWKMAVLALLVGMISGFGAIVFNRMIGLIHNILFLGKFSIYYDSSIHTPESALGAGIILIPVIGAVVVAFLVKNFAPEAKGHGVPEVMESVYFKKGIIRPVVGLVKAVASAVSIGSGGSVGREGPFVQVGAAFGSTLGQIIKMPSRQRNILIAAGAAAGIAATFNTPVGGLTFGIELILLSITAATVFPVAIATVTACFIARTFIEIEPCFFIPSLIVPSFSEPNLMILFIFVPFGVVLGLLSWLFIKGMRFFENFFDNMKGNYYTRHILGMGIIGVMLYFTMQSTGHYYIGGVGYSTIYEILTGLLTNPWLLLILVLLKLIATFITIGSGGSGGIFSPSLYLGAAFGAGWGGICKIIFPELPIDPVTFALAGMAGVVCGATGAVLTAIVMLTEMVHNMNFVLPVIITVSSAYAVRKAVCNESIYTDKLLHDGYFMPEGLQAAVSNAMNANHILSKNFEIINISEIAEDPSGFLLGMDENKYYIVHRDEIIIGILNKVSPVIAERATLENFKNYIDNRFLLFRSNNRLPEIMTGMREKGAEYGIVTTRFGAYRASNVIGVISEREFNESSMKAASLAHV
ncbi:MAG: chloride channel protein [Victivallales bacterium]|nr:chloride channel protein [Victivallales bacterium]